MTLPFDEDVQADAARWVARMDGENWSEESERALQNWLDVDPQREGVLLQVHALWLSAGAAVAEPEVRAAPEEAHRFAMSRRQLVAASVTAFAVSASGLGYWFARGGGTSYTTALGEIRRVPLADGSTAAINTDSSIRADIGAKQRTILLARGEAWFQVAHDRARPFIVESGRVRVRAVGTAFSVRQHETGSEVKVTEGVVDVWVSGAEGHMIRLGAGKQALVAENAAIQELPMAPSAIDKSLAWRDGKIDLAGARLRDAVGEFNRYNVRKIVLVDPALGDERFDGLFRTDDPEGFANALRDGLGLPVDTSRAAEIRIGALDSPTSAG